MAKYAGVDLSYVQSKVDYEALASGNILGYKVRFAMIRIGYSTTLDRLALKHIAGCKAAGIHVGLYLYSYATTEKEAIAEANFVLKAIRDNNLDGCITYPIAFDVEEERTLKLGKAKVTAICKAFLDTIEAANYQSMLYLCANSVVNHVDINALSKYWLWVAAYIKKERLKSAFNITNPTMWQHSVAGHKAYDTYSVGSVPGVAGQCDCNWAYSGLAAAIKKSGKNHFIKQVKLTATKTVKAADVAALKQEFKTRGFTVTTKEVT